MRGPDLHSFTYLWRTEVTVYLKNPERITDTILNEIDFVITHAREEGVERSMIEAQKRLDDRFGNGFLSIRLDLEPREKLGNGPGQFANPGRPSAQEAG